MYLFLFLINIFFYFYSVKIEESFFKIDNYQELKNKIKENEYFLFYIYNGEIINEKIKN